MKEKTEHQKFKDLASKILAVPHAEVKAKLDAEKKARERKKAKNSSASHAANEKD